MANLELGDLRITKMEMKFWCQRYLVLLLLETGKEHSVVVWASMLELEYVIAHVPWPWWKLNGQSQPNRPNVVPIQVLSWMNSAVVVRTHDASPIQASKSHA